MVLWQRLDEKRSAEIDSVPVAIGGGQHTGKITLQQEGK
jgi:hypothetical protein